jgi:hypothetical protein
MQYIQDRLNDAVSVFIDGASATVVIWLIHGLSFWFLFDASNMEALILKLLTFSESIIKILSTLAITYWTYKGIAKTLKKKDK